MDQCVWQKTPRRESPRSRCRGRLWNIRCLSGTRHQGTMSLARGLSVVAWRAIDNLSSPNYTWPRPHAPAHASSIHHPLFFYPILPATSPESSLQSFTKHNIRSLYVPSVLFPFFPSFFLSFFPSLLFSSKWSELINQASFYSSTLNAKRHLSSLIVVKFNARFNIGWTSYFCTNYSGDIRFWSTEELANF